MFRSPPAFDLSFDRGPGGEGGRGSEGRGGGRSGDASPGGDTRGTTPSPSSLCEFEPRSGFGDAFRLDRLFSDVVDREPVEPSVRRGFDPIAKGGRGEPLFIRSDPGGVLGEREGGSRRRERSERREGRRPRGDSKPRRRTLSGPNLDTLPLSLLPPLSSGVSGTFPSLLPLQLTPGVNEHTNQHRREFFSLFLPLSFSSLFYSPEVFFFSLVSFFLSVSLFFLWRVFRELLPREGIGSSCSTLRRLSSLLPSRRYPSREHPPSRREGPRS